METQLQKFRNAGYVDISHTKKPQFQQSWSRFLVNVSEGTAVCVNCLAQFNLDQRNGRGVAMGGHMSKHCRNGCRTKEPPDRLDESEPRAHARVDPDDAKLFGGMIPVVVLTRLDALENTSEATLVKHEEEEVFEQPSWDKDQTADCPEQESHQSPSDKYKEFASKGYRAVGDHVSKIDVWVNFLVNQY